MTFLKDNPDLLRRFREGSSAALEAVYRNYVAAVEAIARHGAIVASSGATVIGPVEYQDRLDLVQETFARAFSKPVRLAYDGLREYRPYLLAICRNLVVDLARRRGRELPSEMIDDEVAEASGNRANDAAWAEPNTLALVERYLAKLPPELAGVHRQRYVLSVSQEQAAESLGISRQKVRTLEKKLKKGLRKALNAAKIKWKP